MLAVCTVGQRECGYELPVLVGHWQPKITSLSVMPSFFTSSRPLQQLSIGSENHRHAPFQMRLGSIPRAFNVMLNAARPQYAGSSWVLQAARAGHGASRVCVSGLQVGWQ